MPESSTAAAPFCAPVAAPVAAPTKASPSAVFDGPRFLDGFRFRDGHRLCSGDCTSAAKAGGKWKKRVLFGILFLVMAGSVAAFAGPVLMNLFLGEDPAGPKAGRGG